MVASGSAIAADEARDTWGMAARFVFDVYGRFRVTAERTPDGA
jgi:hypothetical protein